MDKKIVSLLERLLPDMEARVKGLQEAWPAPIVLDACHRNERLVDEIKQCIEDLKK